MGKKFFRNLKMKQKVVFVSVITIILLWVAVVSVAVRSIQNIYNRKIEQIIQQTVEQTSKYVSTEYVNIINLVHYSVNMEEFQAAVRYDINNNQRQYIRAQSVISPILSQLRMQNPFIETTALIIRERWFYGDIYKMKYDIDEIMEQVKDTPLIYWSKNFVINEETGKQVLPVVMKLPSGGVLNAENEAYMVINIDTVKMFEYLGQLETNLQCQLVIHSDGQVIFGDEQLFRSLNEKQYIINETEIDINGWLLTCAMNRDEIYLDMNQTILNMLVISLLIAVICILIANYVAASVTTPIHKLIEKTRQLEQGDFTVRCNLDGKDEIGELGRSFNAMSSQIEQYIKMLEEEKQQVKISEEQKRKAELHALQAQINPHFLYNTLDSLYWYSLSGKKEEIGKIVIDLSNLLRIGLSKGAETITIENEIRHVENYLEIQKIIFSDKFDYQIHYDPAIRSWRIIKLLLQPLAENCLNHGFANLETGGRIEIKLNPDGDYLNIAVSDNGGGFQPAQNQQKSEYSGYALHNITERLKLHYDQDATIEIDSVPNQKTTVTIRILIARLI